MRWPVRIRWAAIALTIVPPVDIPALIAVDCMQLFSRIVISVFARPMRVNVFHSAYDRMQAVIATPNPQPALRPT